MNKSLNIYKNWPRILVILAIAILAAYFASMWFGNRVSVPRDFLEARTKGANIADGIVQLSEESIKNLKEISLYNEKQDYGKGLNLVLQEITRNEEGRKKAIELSTELERMAKDIPGVRPKGASDLALQAVIAESQIVQRLINYNGYILELLNNFRLSFTKSGTVSKDSIKTLIDKMNEEISAINDLNMKYKDLMAEFDNLTESK